MPALKNILFFFILVLFLSMVSFFDYRHFSKIAVHSQLKRIIITEDVGSPLRIKIPRIFVDAAVQNVGVTQDGSMDVPTNSVDAGWYKFGTRPGNEGSAVIAGHLDSASGEAGIFSKLNTLVVGDVVLVKDDKGKTMSFLVLGSHVYNPSEDTSEIFGKINGKNLSLITCDGVWDNDKKNYSKRLVVFAQATK